jgi:hypothetical protein
LINPLDILPETIKSYDADDSEEFKAIVAFDCRGYMPIEFQPLVSNKRFIFINIKDLLLK